MLTAIVTFGGLLLDCRSNYANPRYILTHLFYIHEYIPESIFHNVIKDPLNKIYTLNRVKEIAFTNLIPGENVEIEFLLFIMKLSHLFNFRITLPFSIR